MVHGEERSMEVQSDVLPVGAEVHRDLDLADAIYEVARLPELIVKRVLHGYLVEKVVPRMAIVAKPQYPVENLQRVPGRSVETPVDIRTLKDPVEGAERRPAEKSPASLAEHADGVEHHAHETAAEHAAVPGYLPVDVEAAGPGEDRLEVGWAFQGSVELLDREVADTNHAHVAVAPGLLGGPLDHVVQIATLCLAEQRVSSFAATGTASVYD